MVLERRKMVITIFSLCLLISLILSGCSSEPPGSKKIEKMETSQAMAEITDMDGFPPAIPHGLEGREECLVCHRAGEVGKTPKTPHSQLTNCRQCHVLSQ